MSSTAPPNAGTKDNLPANIWEIAGLHNEFGDDIFQINSESINQSETRHLLGKETGLQERVRKLDSLNQEGLVMSKEQERAPMDSGKPKVIMGVNCSGSKLKQSSLAKSISP